MVSKAISISGRSSTCYFRDRLDTLLKLDDGAYSVVDFKTLKRKSEHIPLYARQLHAYALALEKPAPGLKFGATIICSQLISA